MFSWKFVIWKFLFLFIWVGSFTEEYKKVLIHICSSLKLAVIDNLHFEFEFEFPYFLIGSVSLSVQSSRTAETDIGRQFHSFLSARHLRLYWQITNCKTVSALHTSYFWGSLKTTFLLLLLRPLTHGASHLVIILLFSKTAATTKSGYLNNTATVQYKNKIILIGCGTAQGNLLSVTMLFSLLVLCVKVSNEKCGEKKKNYPQFFFAYIF